MKTHPIIRPAAPILLLAVLLCQAAGVGVGAAQDLQPVVPEAWIVSPAVLAHGLHSVPISPSPVIGFVAQYDQPDVDAGHYRWIVKPAQLASGQYVASRFVYNQHIDELMPFDDPLWSPWTAWPDDGSPAVAISSLAEFDDQGNRIHYLFSAQVMMDDGVVSTARAYGRNVANFSVSSDLSPRLAVMHPLLETWVINSDGEVAVLDLLPGLPDGFTFDATADIYGSELASYRWGWDLADPDDPNDPGWAVPPGLGDAQRHTPPIPFTSGVHTLTVEVIDTAGGRTRWQLVLSLVPIPSVPDQMPLLLVDDVRDRDSNGWVDADGIPRDRDPYRDAFWQDVLAGAGGVADYDPAAHSIDTEEEHLDVRDLVAYRTVVWNGRYASADNTQIAAEFRPGDGGSYSPPTLKYVWLGAYQELGGNLLYAGSRAAMNFLPQAPYLMPVVLGSEEGSSTGYDYMWPVGSIRVSFGQDDLGPIHPRLYPSRNLGLAAVDVTSPAASYYTPDGSALRDERQAACVGLKGLVLDDAFIADHMGGSAAFADTIWTDDQIDWNDDPLPDGDVLAHVFPWGNDEFYDVDILNRGTPLEPQDCAGQDCVEPLWRMASRFDWVRAARLDADPQDTWPIGYYGGPDQPDLIDRCGNWALAPDRLESLTNDQVTAFVTRKFLDQKPSGAGDVVLGFDPYRFDHQAMKSALRWILGEHFGLAMSP